MILCHQKWNLEKLFRLGLFGTAALLLLSFAALFGKTLQRRTMHEESLPLAQSKLFNYDTIGTGALLLNPPKSLDSLPYLNEELLLVSQDHKPGKKSSERLLVCLKSAQQEKLLVHGERAYLEGGALFTFSDHETPLWIRPLVLDRSSVLMQVCNEKEMVEFLLKKSAPTKSVLSDSFLPFKTAEYWGRDLFLQRYGGEESLGEKECEQLLFKNPSYACLVREGSYLAYIDQQWRTLSLDQISEGVPVALVKSVSAQKIELEAWEGSGFQSRLFSFEKKTGEKFFKKAEEIFTALRRRTASQFSCYMAGRKLMLKKGDWLLQTESGWHKLTDPNEIDAYAEQRTPGELLILDDVKKEKNKSSLVCTLFNKSRTQVQTIIIPLNEMTEKKRASKKSSEAKQ